MVNQLQVIAPWVVKVEPPRPSDPRATSKAGLALVQTLARRVGLAGDIERHLPARKDPTQGFTVPATLLSLVHGLLSGGRGFSATEPLRGDTPLLALLGLERAPAAETVEGVIKYLADDCDKRGAVGMGSLLRRNARRLIERSPRGELLAHDDFVLAWGDGSLAEVVGQCFDAIKVIDGERGQMVAGMFVGPYATGLTVAGEGEGEQTAVRGLIQSTVEEVLGPSKLIGKTLFVLDSLYGDGPTLDQLESYRGAHYIVGARKLAAAHAAMAELSEHSWRDTGENRQRGWEASGVTTAWMQCQEWAAQRAIVCRRWRNRGEMIWNYTAVLTNLTQNDSRIANRMRRHDTRFEETIWGLYDRKQALENQWKEMLSDLGLHHPPCARATVNAIFYGAAALAYNLAVGVRLIALEGPERRMRLWRLRRDLFDVAGRAARHGRVVVVRLLAACPERIDRLLAAMGRLARC